MILLLGSLDLSLPIIPQHLVLYQAAHSFVAICMFLCIKLVYVQLYLLYSIWNMVIVRYIGSSP